MLELGKARATGVLTVSFRLSILEVISSNVSAIRSFAASASIALDGVHIKRRCYCVAITFSLQTSLSAMPISEEAQQLAALLLALTQPDTQGIRQAEVALKPLLKDPRCVPALIEILKARSEQSDAVRHIASIVLRKRLPGHYSKFDAATQAQLKSELLTILSSEPERNVRKGVVDLAAAILKVSPEAWPELWSFVAAASQDSHPDARELAFWLLAEMTDTVGEHLKSHFQELSHLFSRGLGDDSPKVQKAAVKALGQLMSYLAEENEIDIFCNLIPSVLQVAASCAQSGDEDTVAVVLDVLYDLTFSTSAALAQHTHAITSFGLMCMSSPSLDIRVRDSGALIVATLAEARPKVLGRDEALVNQVLDTLFRLIESSPSSAAGALFESNPAWRDDLEGNEDDEFEDSPTETSMAQGTLDMIACEVPKKYIFEPLMTRCISRLQSPNPSQRKAGIAGLGVIAEGCSEPLREHLGDVMPLVFTAAGDADPQVRECACFALGQLSEHCRPEILGYSSQILPIVFQLLDDSAVTVQATSCYVLEMFCERLEPEAVRPLLDPLVRKLAAMLEATNKRSVQEMAVAALAATAVAAEDEFQPYVSGVADLMQKRMALTDESMFSLRGRALECMGHMAIAVGKDAFEPYFVPTMQCALEGLAMDNTDLHEFAYAVFANLAKVMEQEFAPALNELVPHLIQVIGTDEGQLEAVQDTEAQTSAFDALDDSDDEDGEGGNYVIQIRTALLEAKKGAITALGEMAAHSGAAFFPFLEESMKVLQNAATNWHPLIKLEVADALPSLLAPSIAAYDGGEIKWTKSEVNGNNPMSPQTTQVASAVLQQLIELMTDDDKDVVGKACEGAQSVIELCGPHALGPVTKELLTMTHELLNKKAPCQNMDNFAILGDYGGDDDDDHDTFMQAVCDLLGSYPRVMGPQFAQYLPQFLPAVCDWAKSSRPSSDRSMAMGCLSEIAQESGRDVGAHWNSVFLPAVLAGLADPDDNVKRNAAFCAGVCCESLGDSIADKYPQLLQAISPLFSVDISKSEASAACVDNAAAALSRMIMACPNQIPMPQVLPALLKALPLKSDVTENPVVYKCLLGLIQGNHPDLAANKDELKRVLTAATAENSDVLEEIQVQIRPILPSL